MKFYHLTWAFLAYSPLALAKEEIHLQWAICDRDAETVLQKLGEDIRPPYKSNPITYYDTQPPTHLDQGVMFRRKVNKGTRFSLIKVRFDDRPKHEPEAEECVWDRYGHDTFYTCGEKHSLEGRQSTIWSDSQVDFAEQYDDVEWESLVPYGPFPDGKWKLRINGHKAKLDDVVAGDLHLMEIEMEFKKKHAEDAYQEVTNYLLEHGVVLCDHQYPKTKRLFQSLGYLGKGESTSEEL